MNRQLSNSWQVTRKPKRNRERKEPVRLLRACEVYASAKIPANKVIEAKCLIEGCGYVWQGPRDLLLLIGICDDLPVLPGVRRRTILWLIRKKFLEERDAETAQPDLRPNKDPRSVVVPEGTTTTAYDPDASSVSVGMVTTSSNSIDDYEKSVRLGHKLANGAYESRQRLIAAGWSDSDTDPG